MVLYRELVIGLRSRGIVHRQPVIINKLAPTPKPNPNPTLNILLTYLPILTLN